MHQPEGPEGHGACPWPVIPHHVIRTGLKYIVFDLVYERVVLVEVEIMVSQVFQ